MNTYKIFKNPTGKYEAVKQGWSWPAFFFGAIWACFKQMWGLGLGIIVALFVLGAASVDNEAMNVTANILSFIVGIVLGAKGNSLREGNLLKRGYQQASEVVEAKNPEAAVAVYISQYEQQS